MHNNKDVNISSRMKAGLISQSFSDIKKDGRVALMPFIMAGDPDLNSTEKIILKLQSEGADLIELGIPYSDPLADGPVIQAAAKRALDSGTTPQKVFQMLSRLSNQITLPIILFTYSNPLIKIGMEKFCIEASDSGASGLVVPDLPLEEAEVLSGIAKSRGIDLVLLVAPTTPYDRVLKITRQTRGFTYLVSLTGVTGERAKLNEAIVSNINHIKKISTTPIAVGFGISSPEHVAQVREWGADGAIVGSAFVNRISSSSSEYLVDNVGEFCKKLREATV